MRPFNSDLTQTPQLFMIVVGLSANNILQNITQINKITKLQNNYFSKTILVF